MLFQMVPFILLCMVAHSTITWLVESIPLANQRALCWWFLKLPWREKRKVPSERAMKTKSETSVKSDTPFCSRLPIEKTNSDLIVPKTSSSWHQFLEGLFEVAQSALNLASCVVTRTTEILGQYAVCGVRCEGPRTPSRKIDANLD